VMCDAKNRVCSAVTVAPFRPLRDIYYIDCNYGTPIYGLPRHRRRRMDDVSEGERLYAAGVRRVTLSHMAYVSATLMRF